MALIGDIWSNLKFNAGKAAQNAASNISWTYKNSPAQEIIYKNNRAYKSVLVYTARRLAMSAVDSEIKKLFPKYQRYLEKELRDYVLQQQKENQIQLIRNQETQMKDWGRIDTLKKIEDGKEVKEVAEGHTIIAKDKYGNLVREALMLYYVTDTPIEVSDTVTTDGKTTVDSYKTSTICFIDLNPDVSIQSAKNIVQTNVQGRDYSRKELISGGDLNFTVTGEIVSNEPNIYPENDVRKFIQIMQYGGIVRVKHFQFQTFNVEKILIKDFNMPNQEFKNIQPYTFTCVAVEPDEDVVVRADTIAVLNKEIVESPMASQYRLILNNKYNKIAANTVASAASSIVNGGIDALIPNI